MRTERGMKWTSRIALALTVALTVACGSAPVQSSEANGETKTGLSEANNDTETPLPTKDAIRQEVPDLKQAGGAMWPIGRQAVQDVGDGEIQLIRDSQALYAAFVAVSNYEGTDLAKLINANLTKAGEEIRTISGDVDAGVARLSTGELLGNLAAMEQYLAKIEECCNLRPELIEALRGHLAELESRVLDLRAGVHSGALELVEQAATWVDDCCNIVIREIWDGHSDLIRTSRAIQAAVWAEGSYEGNDVAKLMLTRLRYLDGHLAEFAQASDANVARQAALDLVGDVSALEQYLARIEDCCNLKPELRQTFLAYLGEVSSLIDTLMREARAIR